MKDLSDSTLDHLRWVAELPDLTGTKFDLEDEIGRGGLGVVYAAMDRQLGRRVAIKVLDSQEEAHVIANLEHPSIVPVYEAGVLPDGRAFYAMKLVSGVQLDRYLDGKHSVSERLTLIGKIGEALAFAHSKGVLHRDLKPQNVMIGSFGEVYVMDWGVSGVAGTPRFRAPEQERGGGAVDERSDVYAFGALLKFVLADKPAKPLAAIAAKAKSVDPARRYGTIAEMMRDLQRFQDGLAVEAYPESIWQRSGRFAVRNRVLLLLLAAYVLVRFFLFFLRRF